MENKRFCEICGVDITHMSVRAILCSKRCQCKKSRINNPDRSRIYYIKNRDTILEKHRNRRKDNNYRKEYYIKNKEKISELNRNYYKKNKDMILLNSKRSRKIYFNNRIKNDLLYKIYYRVKSSILSSLRYGSYTKKSRTYEILGCSYSDFKIYLESKFEPWMNWDNYGKYNGEFNFGWDIDHIIPISSAKTEEDMLKLNHYTNLQPLCSYVNRVIKKDKLEWEK